MAKKVNLVKNPSAEVDTWGIQNAGRATDQAWIGGASYKFSGSNLGAGDPFYMVVGIDLASCSPVVPGQSYQVAFRWRSDRSECKIRCSGLNFMTNAGNDFLGGSTIGGGGDGQLFGGSSVAGTVNVWNTYQRGDYVNSIIAPANAVGARIYISIYLSAAITGTMNVWIDGIHMAPAGSGERIPDYVDGTLGPTYGWDGTPHRSTSYVTPPASMPVVTRTKGTLTVQTTLWVADRYGNKIARVATRKPVAGSVTANEDLDVKRQMALTVNDPLDFAPFQTFLIPEITMADPYGNVTTARLGHFIVTQPTIYSRRGRQYGMVEGQSALEWIYRQMVVGQFVGAAGQDGGDVVRALLMTANPDPNQLAIPKTGVLLASDWKPDPGTPILVAAGNLLNAQNHYVPWCDGDGVLRTRPYRDLSTTPATARWHTDEGTGLLPEIQETPSYERMRNAVVVRRLQPDKAPIWYKARITNQSSPLYYDPQNPNIGLGVELAGDPVENNDIETTAQAKALAESLLSEGASYYRKLSLGTIADLKADLHDVIDLEVRDGDNAAPLYDGKWWRRTWTLQLNGISAVMQHELYKAQNWR